MKTILCGLFLLSAQSYAQSTYSCSFDEEQSRSQLDSLISISYVSGIDGKAALFDGYTSELHRSGVNVNKSLFVEVWIAPSEYSYNISSIVRQQNESKQGFDFAINHLGQLVLTMATEQEPLVCITTQSVPCYKWSHVAFSYEEKVGIKIYINGVISNSLDFTDHAIFANKSPLVLGVSFDKMAPTFTERATSKGHKLQMRYSGLIDELKISDKVPTIKTIAEQVNRIGKVNQQALGIIEMPARTVPQGEFGAYYTRLRFSDGWESLWRVGDYADVVVRFPDSPIKYVFWRGTGYIPAVVTENNIWMTDQSVENFSTGECYETMGDKQCRYSHVRILESTPARCVVHWRYALASINHQIMHEDETGWGDWVDEYWTIYPDGVAVRKQILYSDHFAKAKGGYQFQETIIFNQPGTKPQDNIEMDAIEFCDMDGNTVSYSWKEGAPKKFDKSLTQPIQLVNLKSEYKPFSIFHPERTTKPFPFGWVENYSTFPCWNHWPVSQIRSDGRNATSPDRPSHSSLAETNGSKQIVEYGQNKQVIARQMIGMTTKPITSLLALARSWNYAPSIEVNTKDFKSNGYDIYQRAYLLESINDNRLDITLHASKMSPVLNPTFVIKGWGRVNLSILINGKPLDKEKVKIGLLSTLEGKTTIVSIELQAEAITTISIK